MKDFNYRILDADLMTPEIMNLVAKIHEYKGKQTLFLTAKMDILEALLNVAKIQSTGASNRIEGIFTQRQDSSNWWHTMPNLLTGMKRRLPAIEKFSARFTKITSI